MSYKETKTFDIWHFTEREKKLIEKWLKDSGFGRTVLLTKNSEAFPDTSDFYFFSTTNYTVDGCSSTLTESKIDKLKVFLTDNKIKYSLGGYALPGYSLCADPTRFTEEEMDGLQK